MLNFLVKCAQIGYPHSLVPEIVNSKELNDTVTNGWWERFIKRHHEVSLRTPTALSNVRAMDRDSLHQYFDLLKATPEENNIFDSATQISNCDETGLSPHLVAPKHVLHIGLLDMLFLFLLCLTKFLNIQLIEGDIPGTAYGVS